eukprot:scaffold20606_cov58-Attheya_sp.AAC.8
MRMWSIYLSGNHIIMQFSEDKTVKDVPFDHVCKSIFGDSFDLHRMKMEVVKYIFSRIKLLPCVRDILVSIENLSLLLDFGKNGKQITHIDTCEDLLHSC